MVNSPQIFSEVNHDELNELKPPMKVARVVIFTLAVLSFIAAVSASLLEYTEPEKDGSSLTTVPFICFGLFYLVLGFVSLRRLFISAMIVSLVNLFWVALGICRILECDSLGEARFTLIFLLGHLLALFFLIRGGVFAQKYETLARETITEI